MIGAAAACREPATWPHAVTRLLAASRTFGSLGNRNYRLFTAGQVVSNTGSWMQRVAQDWLVLELTHGSGTALGVTTGLQFLPMLASPPLDMVRSSQNALAGQGLPVRPVRP